jgi:hypothetical protein
MLYLRDFKDGRFVNVKRATKTECAGIEDTILFHLSIQLPFRRLSPL